MTSYTDMTMVLLHNHSYITVHNLISHLIKAKYKYRGMFVVDFLLNWLFNVTINDISVIYVTAHRCAGGLKKKFDLRSGSQRHRLFVGFFNVPVLAPTRDQPFYTVIPTLKRSVDMTSLGKNGLNIRTNASPKWDRTRCPEELASPVG